MFWLTIERTAMFVAKTIHIPITGQVTNLLSNNSPT